MIRMPIDNIPLSPEWRRALEMLANAGERGSAEEALIARRFSAEVLASIVRTGLATATTNTTWWGNRQIRAPWMRITNAGRFVLKDQRCVGPR